MPNKYCGDVPGLFLFLVEIAILCWVKFWDYSFAAATAATVIVIPGTITTHFTTYTAYYENLVYKIANLEEALLEKGFLKRTNSQTYQLSNHLLEVLGLGID